MLKIFKNKLKQAIIYSIILLSAVFPCFSFAGNYTLMDAPSGLPDITFEAFLVNIVDWLLGFVAIIALLVLVWGGIQYLTSSGDIPRIEQGKKTVVYAIIGLLFVGISYSIVEVVYNNWLGGFSSSSFSSGPIISSANVAPVSGPMGTVFTITVNITDSDGVDSATTKVHIQNPNETDAVVIDLFDDGAHSDGAAGNNIYGNTWDSTGFPDAAYYVDITACDIIGNCSEAEDI